MGIMADGRYYNEHDDRLGSHQFRQRKVRGPFRGCLDRNVEVPSLKLGPAGDAWPWPPGRCLEKDGGAMSNGQDKATQQRFNPYGRPNRAGPGQFGRDRKRGGGMGNHRLSEVDQAGEDTERGGPISGEAKSWYKITIPYGRKYNKNWLLSALQNHCPIPFTPVNYFTEGQKVQFYLEDATAASALCKVSRRITDNEGYKVVVIMNPCVPPSFTKIDLKEEDLQHLKKFMSERFDGSVQLLNLQSICTDQALVSRKIKVILNRRSCMQAVIKIIKENISDLKSLNLSNNRLYKLDDLAELVDVAPNLTMLNLSDNELKSERELDKVKGFRLTELWLNHNPLCDHFKDKATYISAVQQRFPRLLKLDGHSLPAPIGFDLETRAMIPPSKGSYFGTDEIKEFIMRFLQQYYSVYDSGDRQLLLEAYHDGACFSISLPSRSTLDNYQIHSRNFKKVKDSVMRLRLLKHTRLNVVAFLNQLPKTQHDLASFCIDVNTYTQTLLAFTVSGVFKEVDTKPRDLVRAFSRVFVAVPASNSGLCLVNDELFVRNANSDEVRRAFTAPTPSSSPELTLTTLQKEMLSEFSQKSQMNLEWSQRCLQHSEWDFNRAVQLFTELKAQGSIPDVAFIS
ncbi:nuclear RNA export factor 1 isoform X2 [Trichomycterus rosablanca]|uniref:nuclear RNA export factor 1 isoform X2 n=1 Tax=Trichomycterus rosablanca TaxID=2290929 RepID=UPI002F3611F8